MISVHFINVGFGNMVFIIFSDGKVLSYDCNLTEENKNNIFAYLNMIMPKNEIDVFINSHRDADHMRGIKSLHEKYPIKELWDSGVSGNIDTPEYRDYMEFRRNTENFVVGPFEQWDMEPRVKILNGKRTNLVDPNSQSIVVQVINKGSSVLLTGDTNSKVWKDHIIPEILSKVKSTVLLASHHGSITFFKDSDNEDSYYLDHIKEIKPDATIVSVGSNIHGLPDSNALDLYRNYSKGTDKGDKIFRTDIYGNIIVDLNDDGNCVINLNQ